MWNRGVGPGAARCQRYACSKMSPAAAHAALGVGIGANYTKVGNHAVIFLVSAPVIYCDLRLRHRDRAQTA